MVSDVESNLGKEYRGRLKIVRDILVVAHDSGDSGSKKTHIMYGANLSYKLLARYLDEALKAGLICRGESCYIITKKGKAFLQAYEAYEKEHREIEKQTVRLNNGKAELEKMLLLTSH